MILTETLISKPSLLPKRLKPPIFIIGCVRSGTTLLLHCLSKHKRIYSVKNETYLFVRYTVESFLFFERFEEEKNFEKLLLSILTKMFYTESNTCKLIRVNNFPPDIIQKFKIIHQLPEFKDINNKYEVFNLCAYYFTAQENKKRWVEKTPNNIHNTDFTLSLYPDAKFVEIYRDPRAVSLSWINAEYSFFKSSNIIECILTWNQAIKKGEQLIKKMPKQYYRLKYEDLINNPECELKKVCAFIDEEFDPKMLGVNTVETFFPDTKIRGWELSSRSRGWTCSQEEILGRTDVTVACCIP